MGLHEPVYKAGVIGLGFGRRDLQMALTCVEVVGQQDVANAFAQVFLVFFLGGIGFGRYRGQHVVEQLAGPLVEASAHHARLGRLLVHVEHILHVGHVFAREGANTPPFFQPGFEFTFLVV